MAWSDKARAAAVAARRAKKTTRRYQTAINKSIGVSFSSARGQRLEKKTDRAARVNLQALNAHNKAFAKASFGQTFNTRKAVKAYNKWGLSGRTPSYRRK